MNVFEPSTNKVAGIKLVEYKLAFVICLSLVAKAADACGDGSSTSIKAGSVLRCCSSSHDYTGYKYSVDGGTHDDNIKFTVENDEGTVILDTGGNCDITQSGTRCSGSACTSSNNNNCQRGPITSGIEAQKICVVMDCENWLATCDVDAFSVTFYKAGDSSSPPPPSPPPSNLVPDSAPESSPPPPSPPPSSSTTDSSTSDTSLNCKCSCCKGNSCSVRLVGSYDASSSSECAASSCRSKFSECPASGESGSVGASYASKSKSPASIIRTSLAVVSTAAAWILVV